MAMKNARVQAARPEPRLQKDGAETPTVRYRIREGVAWVTLARPESYNSYTTQTLVDLHRTLQEATADDRVGAIVLTGEGSRAFCTGGDVKEYATRYTQRPRDYWNYMNRFRAVIEALLRCGKPTIARVNGMAVGGGNELHLACDLSVAAQHAWMGQVGVGVGSVACGGATQWLPITVGDRRAREMLLLNERIPAAQAQTWGLVNRVVPSVTLEGTFEENATPGAIEKALAGRDGYAIDLTRLDEEVDAFTRRLLGMFPECLRYTKQQTNVWKEKAWNETIGHGQEWLTLHFATPEPYEGMTAFAQKRKPAVDALRRRMAEGGSTEYLHGPPARTCPACHRQGLPADFAFCGACGGRL